MFVSGVADAVIECGTDVRTPRRKAAPRGVPTFAGEMDVFGLAVVGVGTADLVVDHFG